MSDCINYYFIRDVDKISEHVFRIHNIEREKKGGGGRGGERERERTNEGEKGNSFDGRQIYILNK